MAQLCQLGDTAKERGLTLLLDTDCEVCGDTLSMASLMAALDHPAVRLHFDTAAVLVRNPGSNGEIALQRVLSLVGGVRLSDVELPAAAAHYVALGRGGGVDFARTRQILQAVEFRGPCVVRFSPFDIGPLGEQRRLTPDQCRQRLEDSLWTLRHAGWLSDLSAA